jgi:hypothetical protein
LSGVLVPETNASFTNNKNPTAITNGVIVRLVVIKLERLILIPKLEREAHILFLSFEWYYFLPL